MRERGSRMAKGKRRVMITWIVDVQMVRMVKCINYYTQNEPLDVSLVYTHKTTDCNCN